MPANSDQDCNGDYFGDAFVDDCGICSEGNSGHEANGVKIVMAIVLVQHFLMHVEFVQKVTLVMNIIVIKIVMVIVLAMHF